MQKTMPTNRLREFFFTAIFSLISITAWSQWEKVDGPYLSSPFISLSAENIVASGNNACIRSIDALYVSFNKAKSWSYAWGGLDTLWPGAFDFSD